MKRKVLILCTLLVLSAAILGAALTLKQSLGAAHAAGNVKSATKTVTISSTFLYAPATLTIKAGTTVVWKNNSTAAHTVTGTGFSSSTINPGATFRYTFTKKGTYSYHCIFHPYMKGTIVVQ